MSGTNSNPLVAQGTLNRLLGSVVFPGNTDLNVTAGYLSKSGISIALDGDVTMMIDTMTGLVTSPEPYLRATVTINMLRTQALATVWRNQWELQSTLGQVSVHSDTAAFGVFDFQNCAITSAPHFAYDGTDPSFVVTVTGIYYINQSLWNA